MYIFVLIQLVVLYNKVSDSVDFPYNMDVHTEYGCLFISDEAIQYEVTLFQPSFTGHILSPLMGKSSYSVGVITANKPFADGNAF